MTVIADTGALYALVDRSDAWHKRILDWWRTNTEQILVPVTVLPELCYLLSTRIGAHAELEFMRSVAAGEFELDFGAPEDIERASELMQAYLDLPLGFVDAHLVSVAERHGTRVILTTDRRHFAVVRPAHAKRLALLP